MDTCDNVEFPSVTNVTTQEIFESSWLPLYTSYNWVAWITLFVQIIASGVCHTDQEYLTGQFRQFPLVLGHEAAGIVESVGPEVTKFSQGESYSSHKEAE